MTTPPPPSPHENQETAKHPSGAALALVEEIRLCSLNHKAALMIDAHITRAVADSRALVSKAEDSANFWIKNAGQKDNKIKELEADLAASRALADKLKEKMNTR